MTQATNREIAGPWPRYWARCLDLLLFMVPVIVAVALFAPDVLARFDQSKLSSILWIVLIPFSLPFEAAVYTLCGNTPGKWLCGIRVLDVQGQKIPFDRYLRRSFKSYLAGLGAGIPIVSLVTLARSYSKAAAKDLLSWDEALGTRAYRIRPGLWRTTLTAGVYLLIVGAFAGLGIALSIATDSPEKELRVIAMVASKDLPKVIDEGTKLERIEAMPNLVLQYTFFLTDIDMKSPEAAPDEDFYATVRTHLKALLCSDADARELRDLGVTFRHVYRDKNGEPVGQVQFASRDCAT